jgi:hypothetical protein
MYLAGTVNNSKTLTGLASLVSATPTTGTVGGINRANSTFWRNQQTSGAQTTSAFDNLRAAMRSIYNLCSNGVADQHPSFATTTRTVFEGYEGLLLANERFTDKDNGDGAFKNEVLKFKGALISYDNDCTSGALYFLNPAFLKLVYKTGAWMKAQAPIRPSNQTADTILIRSMCNLIATQPRRLGLSRPSPNRREATHMAELSGFPQVMQGNTSMSDTTAVHTVATWRRTTPGNLYKYVQFAAAINGEVVAFDGTYIGTRLTSATSRGFVGVALATQAANAFGWVQVYGVNSFVWAD